MNEQHDHFVPQQHLKRFCNADGMLWDLRKPVMRVGTKPRSPKGICNSVEYYSDDNGRGFDDDYLKPIENEFANQFSPSSPQSKREHDAVFHWFVSMIARSKMAERFVLKSVDIETHKSDIKKSRLSVTHEFLRVLSEFDSFLAIYDCQQGVPLITSDSPLCMHTFHEKPSPLILMMPLTEQKTLISGPRSYRDRISLIEANDINLLMFAHADEYVYSSSKALLHTIRQQVCIPHPTFDPDWFERAKKPFFGLSLPGIPDEPFPSLHRTKPEF